MPKTWMNGELIDDVDARVGVGDAGLLHAAGVFTTMRASGGRVFRLDEHLARLRSSSQALYIPLPFDDAALRQATNDLLSANDLQEARLRLTVTRGHSEVDPLHGEVHRSTVFLTAAPLSPYPAEFYEKGLIALLNSEQKLNPYDVQAGHKTLNYFSRFAALREAARRGAGESLWFNVHNLLQSGSISNVFIVENGPTPQLVTPPTNADLEEEAVKRSCPYPKSNVLPGIVRGWVMEHAKRDGLSVQRLPIDVNRLLAAGEVFVTNSVMGVMPVTRLEQKAIGDGTPGPVTRRLIDRFASEIGGDA